MFSLIALPAWGGVGLADTHQPEKTPVEAKASTHLDSLPHGLMRVSAESELDQAIRVIGQRTGGQILRAETRIEGGERIHFIRVLTSDGRVQNWRVDRSGRILD